MKRIVTVQDLSFAGGCSLSAALPVLSAMGLDVSVLPTALLSTHTGYPNAVKRDVSDLLEPVLSHWQAQGFSFDGVLSGYLTGPAEAEAVRTLLHTLKAPGAPVVIDPVMGDHGRLYKGFSADFVPVMLSLAKEADFLLPNLTEACLLTGTPYTDLPTEEEVKTVLKKIAAQGIPHIILTGISFSDKRIGTLGYHAEADTFFACYDEKLPASLPGTGDVFAAVFAGAVTNGLPAEDAAAKACAFTLQCMKDTFLLPEAQQNGIRVSASLHSL